MKVLLLGEYYSTNLGDPLLCNVVEREILNHYPNAHITPFDISGKISYDQYYLVKKYSVLQKVFIKLISNFPVLFSHSNACQVIKRDLLRYFRVVCHLDQLLKDENYDLAIFAGGSLFMNYFTSVIYAIVTRLNKKKIPVIFHSCGMSKLSDVDIKVFKKILNKKNVRYISLRDSYSKFLELFSPNTIVKETYDTAFNCSSFYCANPEKIAEYGIGVIAIEDFYLKQKEIIEYFLKYENLNWKVFTNGNKGDYDFAKKILIELGVEEKDIMNFLCARPFAPEQLIRDITGFKKIVSFRMHSLIIANAFEIPSYGFVWNEKVKEMYNKLGMVNNYSGLDVEIDWNYIFNALENVSFNESDNVKTACYESVSSLLESINLLRSG